MRLRAPDLAQGRHLRLAWLAATALVLAGLLLAGREEFAYRRQTMAEAAVQADILAASVTAALAFDDRPAIQQYVNALRANRRLASVGVYDANGRLLVTLRRGDSPPLPPRALAPQRIYEMGRITVVAPVHEQGAGLGSVHLTMAPDPLHQVLGRHSALALLTVMAFLLLAVLSRAASQLQRRAGELSDANSRLTVEMGERVKAEEALRQSQKMEALGQLTGGIAHDFNNLLQVVHGAFELIRRKPTETQRVAGWAVNGLEAAERGASLTRQLLAFSRAQKLEMQAFELTGLIDGMRGLLARTLGPGIELVFDLNTEDAAVLSDRTQLELAVLNLAINARDAMPNGGRLTVSTRTLSLEGHPVLAAGEYIELCVGDTGEGMAPEVRDRAFDPFFTTKGVGKGTGLGLSQVYGVARQAGGEARIESEPGRGSRVHLLLRRAAPQTEINDAERVGAVLAPPGGATVLVVDDDDDVRRLVADSLDLLGYRVLTASGGAEALEMLEQERPEIMLLDFAMPGMNGAEVASLVRERWAGLPIIFASGYADTEAVERALGADATMLRKPFQMDQLARALATGLAKRGC